MSNIFSLLTKNARKQASSTKYRDEKLITQTKKKRKHKKHQRHTDEMMTLFVLTISRKQKNSLANRLNIDHRLQENTKYFFEPVAHVIHQHTIVSSKKATA